MPDAAEETLVLLERRLAGIEFYLGRGNSHGQGNEEPRNSNQSAHSRLSHLEKRFSELCSKSPGAKKMLQLCTALSPCESSGIWLIFNMQTQRHQNVLRQKTP